eukprot:6490463-Prymnesium_polylepis.1
MSEVPSPFIRSVGTESEAHGLLEVQCTLVRGKRVSHKAHRRAARCRPGAGVLPAGDRPHCEGAVHLAAGAADRAHPL